MSTEEKTAGKRLGWGDCPGVERDPGRLGGAWTFGNTRLPIWTVFENLAGGSTIQEITQNFHVGDEQVRTVLAHASKMLQEETLSMTDREPTIHTIAARWPESEGPMTPEKLADWQAQYTAKPTRDKQHCPDCGRPMDVRMVAARERKTNQDVVTAQFRCLEGC